jgi:hypothetical protein
MVSVSLDRILAEIVAIPAPLVTPKAAGLRAQSLPRRERLRAGDCVPLRMIAIICLAKAESALGCAGP